MSVAPFCVRDLIKVTVGKGNCSPPCVSMCIQIGHWPCTHSNSQEEKFKPGSFLWPLLSHKSSAAALCALEPEPEGRVKGRKRTHPAEDGCGVQGDPFAPKGLCHTPPVCWGPSRGVSGTL